MVLADGEHGEAELVREPRLLDQVAHALLGRDARIEVGEGDESEVHGCEERTCGRKYSRSGGVRLADPR